MLLPGGERAIVDIRKLRDYCLNRDSPRGRFKARVFESVLGITANDAPKLAARLLEIARTAEAQVGDDDISDQR